MAEEIITANRYHFENLKRLPRDVLKEASLLSGYNLMPAYRLADLRGLKVRCALLTKLVPVFRDLGIKIVNIGKKYLFG